MNTRDISLAAALRCIGIRPDRIERDPETGLALFFYVPSDAVHDAERDYRTNVLTLPARDYARCIGDVYAAAKALRRNGGN